MTLPSPGDSNAVPEPIKDDDEQFTKTIPVCACGESREHCTTCKRGFIETVLAGNVPLFKKVTIPTKMIPVCHCGEPRSECDACGQGYMTCTMSGKAPRFKKVAAEEGTPAPAPTKGPIISDMCCLLIFITTNVSSFNT